MPCLLSVSHLSKTYRAGKREISALIDLNFEIQRGEFVTIIGPSGCGKSTVFRILAGLETADEGQIHFDGRPLANQKNRCGKFGYMPQRDALLPWRTVLDNVILGPELIGQKRSIIRVEAQKFLSLFGLEGFEQAWPTTLSGGMRQRAALLRTFLAGREILLLDEPFGALDALTRRELQQWLLTVRTQFQKTILFITHDIDEALFLGDRVLVFSSRPGRIRANIAIGLPHPRQETILLENDFLHYKSQVMEILKARA